MYLTGPCFSDNIEKIQCLFTDKDGDVTSFTKPDRTITNRIISGITVNKNAVCPLPLFRTLGSHNVTITLSNGTNYTGNFEVGKYICNLQRFMAVICLICHDYHDRKCVYTHMYSMYVYASSFADCLSYIYTDMVCTCLLKVTVHSLEAFCLLLTLFVFKLAIYRMIGTFGGH